MISVKRFALILLCAFSLPALAATPRTVRLAICQILVIDSDREIWKAFANRYWPTKYLLDHEGYLRYAHFGEGGYAECEQG